MTKLGKGSLLAVLAAVCLPAIASAPKTSIFNVIRAAEERGYGRLVGVDYVGNRWDVYTARGNRLTEYVLQDGSLRQIRTEPKEGRNLAARQTIRQAIARAQTRFEGTVVSAELEQEEGVRQWSVVITQGRQAREIAVHADTGAIIEVESIRWQPSSR